MAYITSDRTQKADVWACVPLYRIPASNLHQSPKTTCVSVKKFHLKRLKFEARNVQGSIVVFEPTFVDNQTNMGHAQFVMRSFAVKDDCFCLFEGTLENLPSLRQHYGLSKYVNEDLLVIEAYKTFRDRAPYPASKMVGHLEGQFAFVIFDRCTRTVFTAADSNGKVPLYWGITADGCLAFSDDAQLLKSACGKSLAAFPQGCFYSSALGLRSYEYPKNKVKGIPNMDDGEMCGTAFKVDENFAASMV